MSTPEKLKEWIRQVQHEKKLTQAECYTRAGMSDENWSRLINHPPKYPRMPTLEKIALALDEPLSKVLEVAGYHDTSFPRRLTIDREKKVLKEEPLTVEQGERLERLEALMLEIRALLQHREKNL